MTYLLYDGSFQGFLSAIFDVYDLKLNTVRIRKNTELISDLFANKIEVEYNEEKHHRVEKKLRLFLSSKGVFQLWKATLSEQKDIEDILLAVIRYTLEKKKNTLADFGHPAVLELQKILKKIGRERHRMTAFIRFELGKDGIYYAIIEPDFDVLPLLTNHFKNRYANQKWLIFDTRRKYGFYYNLKTIMPVTFHENRNPMQPSILEIEWDNTELAFQQLWKTYFKHATIASRKNKKLHLQQVPKRYWKYLTEKKIKKESH